MIETTADQVDWSVVHRTRYRGDESKVKRFLRWANFNELTDLLEAEEERSDFWLVTQQIGCDWLVPLCSISRKHKVPLIVDLRDMSSQVPRVVLDHGEEHTIDAVSFHEIAMFRVADGLLHVSPGCRESAHKLHPSSRGTRSFTVPCLVTQPELVPQAELPDPKTRRGLVYSGGIGRCDEQTFRNYGEFFERLVLGGVDVHLQAGVERNNPLSETILNQYAARGVVVHDRVPDAQLTRKLTQFKWGFVGFPKAFNLGNAAFPNKLFEYLAAGTPVVVANAVDAGTWVQHFGVGYWIRCQEDFDQLSERLTEELWWECHRNIMRQREQWTYEAHKEELLKFFRQVANHKPAEPGGIWLGNQVIQDPYEERTPASV